MEDKHAAIRVPRLNLWAQTLPKQGIARFYGYSSSSGAIFSLIFQTQVPWHQWQSKYCSKADVWLGNDEARLGLTETSLTNAILTETHLVKSIQCSLKGIGIAALQTLHEGHEELWPCWQTSHSHYHRHICPHHMPQWLAWASDGMQQCNLHKRPAACHETGAIMK